MKPFVPALLTLTSLCSALDIGIPVTIGLGANYGVYREMTGNIMDLPGGVMNLGVGLRLGLGPRCDLSNRVETTIGWADIQSDVLALEWKNRSLRMGGELGFHRQENHEDRYVDRCAFDCHVSNSVKGSFDDEAIYSSLGGVLGFAVNKRVTWNIRLAKPILVFRHTDEQELYWVPGWDDPEPTGPPPAPTNPELRGMLFSSAISIEM